MPSIRLQIPSNLIGPANDERHFADLLMDRLARIGDDFKTILDIAGAEDIWVYIQISGYSNEKTVFGNIYMYDKASRTPEARSSFGNAVKDCIIKTCKQVLDRDVGIDIPIVPIQPSDYVEADTPK